MEGCGEAIKNMNSNAETENTISRSLRDIMKAVAEMHTIKRVIALGFWGIVRNVIDVSIGK